MKIAIFGGAFNPVHREHVNIAKAAVERLALDKLIIVPTAVSPHKSGKITLTGDERLSLCRLAFKDIPCAEVSDYEIAKGGVSYSYITCRHFREVYKDAEIYFLIGADMLRGFDTWKNPKEILSCVKLAACAREDKREFEIFKKKQEEIFGVSVEVVPYVGGKVSSTRIRTLATLGEDFSKYVTPPVCQYIKEKGLFLNPVLSSVKNLLTEERWAHTVRVSILCAENAARANLSEEEAITMGALHDCAKYVPLDDEKLKGFSLPNGVPKPVVHQFTGAYMARNYFKIDNDTVINAIECHTSGKENMNRADALLFLADMLEEGRNFDGVDKLRKEFENGDLMDCLKSALEHQIKYLSGTGKPVYPLTRKAYDSLKEKL